MISRQRLWRLIKRGCTTHQLREALGMKLGRNIDLELRLIAELRERGITCTMQDGECRSPANYDPDKPFSAGRRLG